MREYALSSGDYVGAQENLIQAENTRRDILEDLINKEISASEAMIRLTNSLASVSKLNLKADFDNGIISADQYRQGIESINDGLIQGGLTSKQESKLLKKKLETCLLWVQMKTSCA